MNYLRVTVLFACRQCFWTKYPDDMGVTRIHEISASTVW